MISDSLNDTKYIAEEIDHDFVEINEGELVKQLLDTRKASGIATLSCPFVL